MSRLLAAITVSLSLTFAFQSTASATDITVSAAASLTNAFKDLAQAYEKANPQDKILLNFGASGSLLQQIDKGAPVDVFASADQKTMDQAQEKKLVNPTDRTNFVNNTLVLITPTDSKLKIAELSDLKQDAIKHVAIGNPDTVPNGRYAKSALEKAGLWQALQAKLVNTQNVRQSLDYVSRKEAEAGFVFGTDAALMSDKVSVALKVPTEKAITYPIAQISSSKNAKEAKQFIEFVLSAEAQSILGKYGFEPAK